MRQHGLFYYYWPTVKRYKIWLFAMIFGIITVISAEMILPFLVREFTNLFVGSPAQKAPLAFALLIKMAALYLTLWAGWRINEYSITQFQTRAARDLQMFCFRAIQPQSFRFFTNQFTGALVKKISRFVGAFEALSDIFYFNFLTQILYLTITLIIFFRERPLIGVIFLIWSIIFLGGNYVFAIWKMRYDRLAAAADSRLGAMIADSLGNYATVKTFAREEFEQQRFAVINEDAFQKSKFSANLTNHINLFQSFLIFALEFCVYFLAVKWWQKGQFTPGDLMFFQMYLIMGVHRLWDFGRNIRTFFRRVADAQEMVEILETQLEVKELPQVRELQVKKGKIVFQNVTFRYAQNTAPIFQKFNLTIQPGEKVAIVGHSGEGKSTLIKLLFRFFDLQDGQILIDGQDIAKVSQESLRQNISLVPQDPNLFHRSILENIRYGDLNASREEVQIASKKAQAAEFIQKLPQGYETFVGERGVKLSGGEKQRIAIARAILEKTKILVLDEATSSLDSITEKKLQKAIENAMAGKTVIVIAHRLSTIKKADRVIVLEEGKTVESGAHRELLKAKGKYAELWEQQVGGFMGDDAALDLEHQPKEEDFSHS